MTRSGRHVRAMDSNAKESACRSADDAMLIIGINKSNSANNAKSCQSRRPNLRQASRRQTLVE